MKILITGACGVTSRAVARSLRLSRKFDDLQLIGTDICENPYGLFEGLFDKIYHVPRVNEPNYSTWMEKVCRTEAIEAAIVIPELEVLFWSGKDFPVPVALPPPSFCHTAVSKKRLYEALAGTELVPRFGLFSREELMNGDLEGMPKFPCWIRDFSEGATSGQGSMLAHGPDEVRSWVIINRDINRFMVSDYLPGRNFACHLLYDRGDIVKIACYERLEYFMARGVVSGVSGNISKGRLINDERLVNTTVAAMEHVLRLTQENMHGIIAADLREAHDGMPKITEINLRHVAATYSFATAGFNLAEAQLLLTLGRRQELGAKEMTFPQCNIILRDIDGAPIWLDDYKPLELGEYHSHITRQPLIKTSDHTALQSQNTSASERDLVIWGASGHALVVADILRLMGGFRLVGLLDDVNPERHGTTMAGLRIIGGRDKLDKLIQQGVTHLICGFGDCDLRLKLARMAEKKGFKLATAIHPRATVAPDAEVGDGTVIAGGVVVNPGSRIGRNCIINTSSSVDHECVIGDGTHIGPGVHLGGAVTIGEAVWIGIGAAVWDHIRIGSRSIIGSGALITKDIPDGVVVYGVPGRIIRTVEVQAKRPRFPGYSGTLRIE